MVLTEGFDLPDCGCIGLVRPTRSLGLFRQMVGRGLRPAEGKSDIVILDHAGGVFRHGRPDDAIQWALDVDLKATNTAHAARVAATGSEPFCECQSCGHLRMKGMACENCGWEPKPKGRALEYIDDNLVELGSVANADTDRRIFYAELRGHQQTARKKDGSPYHPKWSACQYKDKHKTWPARSWDNDMPLAPSPATLRWIKSRLIAFAKAREAAR
jgi:superfamily II DNA or RNA helicase